MNDSERASNKLYKILAPLILCDVYGYICWFVPFSLSISKFVSFSYTLRLLLEVFCWMYFFLNIFSLRCFLWYARADLVMTAIRIRLYVICYVKYEAWSCFCRLCLWMLFFARSLSFFLLLLNWYFCQCSCLDFSSSFLAQHFFLFLVLHSNEYLHILEFYTSIYSVSFALLIRLINIVRYVLNHLMTFSVYTLQRSGEIKTR